MNNTYWNSNGTNQKHYDFLADLIPVSGPCRADRPALEKLRVAANCYYDLYNNGLCNEAKTFAKVFGFGGTSIAKRRFLDIDGKVTKLEKKMDEIITNAMAEFNLLGA